MVSKTESKTIFIIDDDDQLLSLLRDVIEIEGWAAITAKTVMIAKQKLTTNDVDCFIVDVKLPDGDGNELIAYLKEHYQAPIIAISGAFDAHSQLDLPATSQFGADYHLSKPFQPDELLIECKRLMELAAI